MDRRNMMGRLFGALAAAVIVGCGGDTASTAKTSTVATGKTSKDMTAQPPETTTILCSFFPVYLFTKNVVGDAPGVNVSLMLPASKGCPHGYDLTPGDGKRIADAKIVVVNGGGLEEFDEKKIKNFNPNAVVVDSTKGLKLVEALCCHDEEEEEGHEHHHHESGKNPHTFTSPLMAAQQVKVIADELAKADPGRREIYKKNAAAYAAKLEALGKELKDSLPKAKGAKVVTSHEIFDYLATDLGVLVVGEVQTGAKGDAPPRKLIEKIKKEKAKAIFTEPQYSSKKAELIAKEAGVPAFQLDPLASGPDDAPADHYEKTMRANLETLKKALGGP